MVSPKSNVEIGFAILLQKRISRAFRYNRFRNTRKFGSADLFAEKLCFSVPAPKRERLRRGPPIDLHMVSNKGLCFQFPSMPLSRARKQIVIRMLNQRRFDRI